MLLLFCCFCCLQKKRRKFRLKEHSSQHFLDDPEEVRLTMGEGRLLCNGGGNDPQCSGRHRN